MNEIVFFSVPEREFKEIVKQAVIEALDGQEITTNDEFIDRNELKRVTNIESDTTVIKYEKMGIFRPRRLGRKLLYRRSEVLEAMRKFQRA